MKKYLNRHTVLFILLIGIPISCGGVLNYLTALHL